MELRSVNSGGGELVRQQKLTARTEETGLPTRDAFESMSPEEQKQCRDHLTLMAAKGRLFKHNPEGGLDPTTALEAYRLLRSGQGELEDVVATTAKTTREATASNQSFYQDYYAGFDTAVTKKRDVSETTVLGYATTPVAGFSDLLWIDTEANGIPGGEHLPNSGRGTVVIAKDVIAESDKRRHYYELNQPEYHTVDEAFDEKRRRLHGPL